MEGEICEEPTGALTALPMKGDDDEGEAEAEVISGSGNESDGEGTLSGDIFGELLLLLPNCFNNMSCCC